MPVNSTQIFNAISAGNVAEVLALQSKYKNFDLRNSAGNTPLHFAILMEKTEIVKRLVEEAGVDINARGLKMMTPVSLSANLCLEDYAVFLVEKGADFRLRDTYNKAALDRAHEKNLSKIKEAIWQRLMPAEIEAEVWTAFEAGHTEDFISLVENHGADIYRKHDNGRSIAAVTKDMMDSDIAGFVRRREGLAAAARLTEPATAVVKAFRPLVYKKKN